MSNTDRRQLYRCLRFYRLYPEIVGTLSPQFESLRPRGDAPGGADGSGEGASSAGAELRPLDDLIARLSYSHLEAIVGLDDPLARRFYEAEAVRGQWSVRELKRQIVTLYFERAGLSTDKAALTAQVRGTTEGRRPEPRELIRDPYVFEFLGLAPDAVMGESAVEDALIDKLQAFLLELGHGFCFEARQKRLLVGGEHFFVDLVFYHRVLKCHLCTAKNHERRGEALGLTESELSFYDALTENESAVRELGDETLRKMAVELTEKLRNSTSVDWQKRESDGRHSRPRAAE